MENVTLVTNKASRYRERIKQWNNFCSNENDDDATFVGMAQLLPARGLWFPALLQHKRQRPLGQTWPGCGQSNSPRDHLSTQPWLPGARQQQLLRWLQSTMSMQETLLHLPKETLSPRWAMFQHSMSNILVFWPDKVINHWATPTWELHAAKIMKQQLRSS